MVSDNLPSGTRIVKVRNYNGALVTYRGEEKTVREWADQIGINKQTLWVRIFDQRWSIERAIEEKSHTSKYGEYSGWSELSIWKTMKYRCENKHCRDYKYYGGRGITICKEWSESFVVFLRDMGRRPSKKHSLERVDNSKGYEPGNVVWATRKEQASNTRRNVKIEYNGKTMILSDLAKEYGLPLSTLRNRLVVLGWNIDRALATPQRKKSTRNES